MYDLWAQDKYIPTNYVSSHIWLVAANLAAYWTTEEILAQLEWEQS